MKEGWPADSPAKAREGGGCSLSDLLTARRQLVRAHWRNILNLRMPTFVARGMHEHNIAPAFFAALTLPNN